MPSRVGGPGHSIQHTRNESNFEMLSIEPERAEESITYSFISDGAANKRRSFRILFTKLVLPIGVGRQMSSLTVSMTFIKEKKKTEELEEK